MSTTIRSRHASPSENQSGKTRQPPGVAVGVVQLSIGVLRTELWDVVSTVPIWLFKLHLVRVGLQIAGIVILGLLDRVAPIENTLPSALGLVSVDALVILVPYLMLVLGLHFLAEPETRPVHRPVGITTGVATPIFVATAT